MKSIKSHFKNAAAIILVFSTSVLFAQTPKNNTAFNKLINSYYDEGIRLNPLGATARGDNRFND